MAIDRHQTARPPDTGDPVSLEDVPGGPLQTVVIQRAEDRLCLDRPRLGGREVRMRPGIRATISYSIHGVPCKVDVVTGAHKDATDGRGLWVTVHGAPERHQRRRHFRVPTAQSIELRRPDPKGEDGEEIVVHGTTVDISLGGAKVLTKELISPQTVLRMAIQLRRGREDLIEGEAVVVRLERPEGRDGFFGIGVAFTSLDGGHEDQLRGFLLSRERELRRREVGLD